MTATLYKEVHAITHSAAQQVLDDTTLATSQTGNDITLTAQIPSITANFTSLQRNVDLTISVPASANLNLTVNAGNADITGIDGALDVTMNAGDLMLRWVTAEGNSSLRLNAGNVDYLGAIAAPALWISRWMPATPLCICRRQRRRASRRAFGREYHGEWLGQRAGGIGDEHHQPRGNGLSRPQRAADQHPHDSGQLW